MTIETNSHIRALIVKEIIVFVVVKTHVVVMPLNESNVNVFRVKDLEIYEHDIQTQREELALSHTF